MYKRQKVLVAGTQRQTVGFTNGGNALHRHAQIKIGHEPAQDHQLLPVLFTQPKARRLHQLQQSGHDRDHPIKVTGTASSTEVLLQFNWGLTGWHSLHAIGIDQLDGWSPKRRCSASFSKCEIGLQAAGIALEILPRAELTWVDEDTHQHRALLGSTTDQLAMPLMQCTQGGNELKRLPKAAAKRIQICLG